jgi:hypothetical protein
VSDDEILKVSGRDDEADGAEPLEAVIARIDARSGSLVEPEEIADAVRQDRESH